MGQWVLGKVTEKTWWTPTLFSLHVVADINPFKAGQFTKLALTVDDKRIARAYSFVNSPKSDELEFFLIDVPNGALSPHLAKLEMGDDIFIGANPSGFFTLDEIPDVDTLWLFSTGTAIGPFLSMILEGSLWSRFNKVILTHGVRHNSDLCYQEQIHATASLFKQFHYVPNVSREDPMEGLKGRITDIIENGTLLESVGLTEFPKSSHFMLCGNPDMVKETMVILNNKGFQRHRRSVPGHVTVEQYW